MQKVLLWPKKNFSWKISLWVSTNAEFYADFKFVDADLNKCPYKKLEPKNYANFEYFRFCAFFHGFLLLTFVRSISESINEFEISIKFSVFLIPIMIFFKKKFFWVIIALFAYFKCKCEKNCTFSNILLKVKSYFFANIYLSPCDSYWNSKKSIKLKPPSVQWVITKGVGTSTTLTWPGWKQRDIPVEVDTARLETSRTDTVKELPGYSVQNCPSGNVLFWGGLSAGGQ